MSDITVKIVPRVSFEGHPFTEILISCVEAGVRRFFCSRVNYVITPSKHSEAAQRQAFINRRQRAA